PGVAPFDVDLDQHIDRMPDELPHGPPPGTCAATDARRHDGSRFVAAPDPVRHQTIADATDTRGFPRCCTMNRLTTPSITPLARDWLEREDDRLDVARRVLLGTIDGQRNIIELESVARALGLPFDAMQTLRVAGLVQFSDGV